MLLLKPFHVKDPQILTNYFTDPHFNRYGTPIFTTVAVIDSQPVYFYMDPYTVVYRPPFGPNGSGTPL